MDIETQNTVYDCIVIGGGISGISFTHYLHKAGKKVLIIEKENALGGQVSTLHSQSTPDFWCELGAHTCYNSYTSLLSIVRDIDGNDLLQPLDKFNYVLHDRGQIKSMFSGISILPFMLNIPKIFFSDKRNKTVREYFRPIVGASNYDKLFTNAFRAVISQNADDYPAEMFLKKRKERVKELPRRFTFKKGMSSYLDSIIEKDKLEIVSSSEITEIKKSEAVSGKLFTVKTSDGNIYKASNIAIATDPQTASVLLKKMESKLSDLLSTISLFKSESLNVVISKESLKIKSIAGIIPLSDEFLSAVSRDLVIDSRLRGFTFHFEKGKKNENEKLELICKVLDISRSEIIEYQSSDHILPSIRIEHLQMSEKVNEKRIDDNIFLLGNYFYGLSLEDCVNRSKEEFERFDSM